MTHPALQNAISACGPLSAASKALGAADPIEVLAHIDCDPESIKAYGDRLRAALSDLDKAIDQQNATIAELEQDDGEGSEAALEEARKELAELESDRAEVAKLADQITGIGQELEKLVTDVSHQIVSIANGAAGAAGAVVDGSASAEDEEHVIKAIDEIIRLAEQFQQQVLRIREEFKKLTDAASEAGVSGGAEAGAERGDEGGGVERDEEGGEGQQGPPGGAGSGGGGAAGSGGGGAAGSGQN
ncbi:hypothetical protein [Amycolatopsis sp. YIM 10]|uniref:hypothetical protein n=1 Tax=Amycolatopsis sp. YIM 10 TaxID=2653857 RepID=UPI001290111E|nr:hypothetical protein [Amycolatopsis sp. YIM 10]QFU94197.1 hypothetical protein YIM_45335 [Amycolatopsis sp. YIM 10]